MILVDAGRLSERAFDAQLRFAAQLAGRGHDVRIAEYTLLDDLQRTQRFEAAPLLTKTAGKKVGGIILIAAEDIAEDTLIRLRSYELDPGGVVAAIGRFETHQMRLTAQTRLAYALGQEPNVVDLVSLQPESFSVQALAPLVTSGTAGSARPRAVPALFVYLPVEALEEPTTLPLLSAMDALPGFRLNVIIASAGKEQIRKTRHGGLSVFGYSELTPNTLAGHADILAFFGEGVPGERMASFALEVMKQGNAVIDCTTDKAFVVSGAPVLRGPGDLGALPAYLDYSILSNRDEIGRTAQDSPWLASHSIALIEQAIGLSAPVAGAPDVRQNRRAIFVPTNGSGLGHAQRCALIAAKLDEPDQIGFMAFPSCVPMLSAKGYSTLPLVQSSSAHKNHYDHDIVNYLRYRRTFQRGDHLVFDGGYVFDSIYRAIMEKALSATWVRRGLQRPGQIQFLQHDREKAFDQVIVPEEAFSELNAHYAMSKRVRPVGPIVQTSNMKNDEIAALRTKLSGGFDHDCDELIVTMLGGGVVADRTAQMQAICALAEQRSRCLHLMVAWPGAIMPPGLLGWSNSHIVTTRNALPLCRAADLVVSAVGYNSYHELLYHGVPAIFMPQVGPHMDDQERRARAASDRGLAETVMAHELLQLEREVSAYLDAGKAADIRARLADTHLPERGNAAAAALIKEHISDP